MLGGQKFNAKMEQSAHWRVAMLFGALLNGTAYFGNARAQSAVDETHAAASGMELSTSLSEQEGAHFTNSLGMLFVKVPAGEFVRRGPEFAKMVPSDGSQHRVRISRAFYIAVDETSQEVFKCLSGSNPSYYQKDGQVELPHHDGVSPAPVENVSWTEAVEFAERVSKLPAEQLAIRRYRLPTEAEWEYVCRTENASQKAKSDRYGQSSLTRQDHLIGIRNIHGGLHEWCSDWYSKDNNSPFVLQDPTGPSNGVLKVIRNTASDYSGDLGGLNHNPMPPWQRNRFVGFRLVCEIQ